MHSGQPLSPHMNLINHRKCLNALVYTKDLILENISIVNLCGYIVWEAVKLLAKPIEIKVSTNQTLLLLLFNDLKRLTYEDIISQLNFPKADVVRFLRSFVCGKYQIILKVLVTQTIAKTNDFEFNARFTYNSERIKIYVLPQIDEKKKVMKVVDGDRCHSIDVAITRTMKARKVLTDQELFIECIQQLQAKST